MLKKLLLVWLLAILTPLAWSAEEGAPAQEEYVNYIELKPFVANFGTGPKTRFVKCEITIQVSSEAAHHAVNHHMPHIRNDIVFLLSSQSEESMKTIEAQQTLARQALKLVQNILVEEEGEAFVSDLFFTSFVMQ
ncbi:flagellar basal body-associated FliL family protein [Marinobacterium arenosum]|uniref:flagellar basal body-associated FliL family protein n=1 Tax=Marinobacterium arenosum TaxID=2862496 RepID=UPI001C97FBB6|nr:flagellar basal body-associated FliL family protein [Marinobacterium arenosum]MBY4675510.1 flagellar basal body-associated FliL family protein [Marinobacterium arenosum]